MMSARTLAAALGIALAATLPATAEDAAMITSLKALAADPSAEATPELSEVRFEDALYLLDGLSTRELKQLRAYLDDRSLRLPGDIASAIRAKTPRRGSNRG